MPIVGGKHREKRHRKSYGRLVVIKARNGYITDMASRKKFPDQMRKAIKNSGLSLYAIAKTTGIQRPQLSRFMSGERGLSIESITAICDLLGLDLVERKAGKPAKGKRATP